MERAEPFTLPSLDSVNGPVPPNEAREGHGAQSSLGFAHYTLVGFIRQERDGTCL